MEQEKKIKWGSVAIVIAILVLAAGIFFVGGKITSTVNTINMNIKNIKNEVKQELKEDIRREVISFIYAYRNSTLNDRQITVEDLEKGYQFADKVLSK